MNNTRNHKLIGFVIFIIIVLTILYLYHKPKSSEQSSPVATDTVSYACDAGKSITATFYSGESKPATADMPPVPGGSASVKLSDGRTMNLTQTISADGVRYANTDDSFVFWSKGNGALVLEDNKEKSYIGCVVVAPQTGATGLPEVYSNSNQGFSLRLPSLIKTGSTDGYKVDESYHYQALGPGKDIFGTKFTIPTSVSSGTNLSQDSYISVEEIPQTKDCSASLFIDPQMAGNIKTVADNNTTYSVVSTSDAAVGNRYEETVYAIPGTNPCVAVRYFIHYGVFENYPAGTITEFNKQSLISQFDQIRRTLVVVK